MTNKCRKKMNEGEGYITAEISQKRKEKKKKKKGKETRERKKRGKGS